MSLETSPYQPEQDDKSELFPAQAEEANESEEAIIAKAREIYRQETFSRSIGRSRGGYAKNALLEGRDLYQSARENLEGCVERLGLYERGQRGTLYEGEAALKNYPEVEEPTDAAISYLSALDEQETGRAVSEIDRFITLASALALISEGHKHNVTGTVEKPGAFDAGFRKLAEKYQDESATLLKAAKLLRNQPAK